MPELPEVRTAAKYLNSSVQNQIISDVWVNKPKMIKELSVAEFKTQLINQKITKVTNYGKFLVFHFASDLIMLSHLRMEGRYHTQALANAEHDHVVFSFNNKTQLYYQDTRQFGTFYLRTTNNYLTSLPLAKLAPEPNEVDAQVLYEKLQRKSLAIKSTLLDQTLISGLGNIYADEVLWAVKIHPLVPARHLTIKQVKDVVKAAREVIAEATSFGGTTIRSYVALDDKTGNFQDLLKVHMKVNQACSRCQTIIKKIKVNGRGTYFCPQEQRF